MNSNVAAQICATFQQITIQIDNSICDAMNELSSEEFNLYRRTAGKIMGDIFFEILQPLYNEQPDLTPPQLRNQCRINTE